MLRPVTEKELKDLVRPLWLLKNNCRWDDRQVGFDQVKCGVHAIISHLAYCDIDNDERRYADRAKVVPCELFQRLLVSPPINLIEVLASSDLGDAVVLRTKSFVALAIFLDDLILMGVRGTWYAYEWKMNLKALKSKPKATGLSGSFHVGYLREAEALFSKLQEYLRDRYAKKTAAGQMKLCVSGHSLGGAVASLLSNIPSACARCWPRACPAPGAYTIGHGRCYIFGAPRIADKKVLEKMISQPLSIRRHLDSAPHLPPRATNFANFAIQKYPNGEDFTDVSRLEFYFFVSWLKHMAVGNFLEQHSMESYRSDVLNGVKELPAIKPHWNFPNLA